MRTPLAIVTGGSRGLGLETARQLGGLGYRLVIAAKDKKRLDAAAAALKGHGFDVHPKTVDMASARSIAAFGAWAKALGPVDVLVNAAGILPETSGAYSGKGATVLGAGEKEVVDTITVNTLGPWRMVKVVAPLLAQNGRVVNVSSGMGAFAEMGSGYFGYRASKAALNMLTRTLAQELSPRGILVNSVCPGWVKTDMGGPNASRSVEQGASGIVWAATLTPGGPSGGFFRDGKPIGW
ncbi:MAG: SDR family NAD(P)-dependent oxidoreductase [Rhizobiales bacterium]|nr:SDR family NAD(P)-dependent oxidoreductase [Hyphomicrobiales bacterium]